MLGERLISDPSSSWLVMVARHFRRPSASIGRVEGGTYDSIKVAEVGLAKTDHGNMAETSVLVALLWMRSYVVERGNEGGDEVLEGAGD